MKFMRFYGLAMSMALTVVAPFGAQARVGGGSDGGGNLEELDFKYRSTEIEKLLVQNNARVAQVLNVDPSSLLAAIHSTPAECSKGDVTELMLKENKLFWFSSGTNTIYIDCARYFAAVASRPADLVKGLILHEYARKAEGESSDYRISRHSKALFKDLAEISADARGTAPERLAEIFGIAMAVKDFVIKAEAEVAAVGKEATMDPKIVAEERQFCFKPIMNPWNVAVSVLAEVASYSPVWNVSGEQLSDPQRPFNEWPANYFKNSKDPRCAKYHVETYKNDRKMLETIWWYPGMTREAYDAGYIVNMPEILVAHKMGVYRRTKVLPEAEKLVKNIAEKLAAIARSPQRMPLERSLAVALLKVLKTLPTEKIIIANRFDPREYMQEFEDKVAFLAFSAGDWMNETDGDLTVAREFALELTVRELDKKVDYAIQLATSAMLAASNAQAEINSVKRKDIIRSAAFWGIAGTLSWSFLAR